MSYRTHVESSWPVTKSRPEGSTVHAATGELQGMTFTQPRVRRSQKRAVLSYEDENAYVNYPFTKNTGTAVVPFRLAAIRGRQGTSHISFTLHSVPHLGPRGEDGPGRGPGTERQDVTAVPGEGGDGLSRGRVRHVNLAVAGAARGQRLRVAHEDDVSHRAVVHGQLRLLLAAADLADAALLRVEAHNLDRLVVGAGCDEVALRAPREAVDGALVVARTFHQHVDWGGPVRERTLTHRMSSISVLI